MTNPDTTTTREPAAAPTASAASRSAFPQFAIDAANERLGAVGTTLNGAADAIDDLFERDALPFGQDFQSLAARAARGLRDTGTTLANQDAGELLGAAQRSAAARPALTVSVGAALGAALAFVLIRTAPRLVPAADASVPVGAGA